MARRPRSLSLSFLDDILDADGPVLRTEVLTALIEAGVPKDDIEGIEAPQRNKYFVVVKDSNLRNHYLNRHVEIRGNSYDLLHPNPNPQRTQRTRVRIFYYPLDEPIENLEKVLQHYGLFTSGSIRDLLDRSCEIKNGIKEVFMEIKKLIPSYIYVGRNLIRINHDGQIHTCRKCHKYGHLARECQATVTCKGCGADDHTVGNCPKVICFQCGEQGHTSYNCVKYKEHFPTINEENGKNEENTVNMAEGNNDTSIEMEEENKTEEERKAKDQTDTLGENETTEAVKEQQNTEEGENENENDETSNTLKETTEQQTNPPDVNEQNSEEKENNTEMETTEEKTNTTGEKETETETADGKKDKEDDTDVGSSDDFDTVVESDTDTIRITARGTKKRRRKIKNKKKDQDQKKRNDIKTSISTGRSRLVMNPPQRKRR